jgi:hypothetical protein
MHRLVLSFLLGLAMLASAVPAHAQSLTVRISESDTPLLSSTKKDAKTIRKAEQGETFTAFSSSLYGGYYMVVDKKTNAFLYIPFSAAEEIVVRPDDLRVSGECPAPSADDLAHWQVTPSDAPYTDGDNMLKYRSRSRGSLTSHSGKSFPASYSYNEGYRPRVDGRALLRDACAYLGTPYVLGGTSGKGIDCSGLTQVCLARQGIDVLHRASLQALEGAYVSVDNLAPGDLVFFRDDKNELFLSHVGIYAGGGKFVHASQGKGAVVVGKLSDKYFKTHYAFARRL